MKLDTRSLALDKLERAVLDKVWHFSKKLAYTNGNFYSGYKYKGVYFHTYLRVNPNLRDHTPTLPPTIVEQYEAQLNHNYEVMVQWQSILPDLRKQANLCQNEKDLKLSFSLDELPLKEETFEGAKLTPPEILAFRESKSWALCLALINYQKISRF